ncbi:hypothetical protein N7474_010850 [Penicillium riverlandense]|uniref:uncharacterized protein n=1 Tax=Penicillium riverlandense TaxID=1903569 RepID=UPI00254716D2|nr:uncharacterized protein N7474_010850 [Penicillium riverlandense]KAJ5804963.1 hypothetical protein N7474_010850 [Penicillium riverlandense]
MSARLSGRQSPPEERQSGAQQRDPPGSGKTNVGDHPPSGSAQQKSEEHKKFQLQSNPEHPLEKIEADKYSKRGA